MTFEQFCERLDSYVKDFRENATSRHPDLNGIDMSEADWVEQFSFYIETTELADAEE